MSAMRHRSAIGAGWLRLWPMALLLGIAMAPGLAQTGASKEARSTQAEVSLDRVIAIVNGDLVLESDLETEQRFAAFQPLREPEPVAQDKLIERLIDRTLILQPLAPHT